MSSPQDQVPAAGSDWVARLWPALLVRAVPALAVGLAITFMDNHSPRIGLVALGALAVASGLIGAAAGLALVGDRVTRNIFLGQAVVSVIIGALAFVLPGGTVGSLLLLLTVFAALTGFLELYAGLRHRGTALGRDWLTIGGATVVVAIVFLLIPADSVLAVGLFGVYGILLGVYLVIAGLSLKWGTQPDRASLGAPSGHPEPRSGAAE